MSMIAPARARSRSILDTMTLLLIGIATFLATFMGGLFALSLRDRLHLILGFSAGAILAVAFFDLLPEALELGGATHANATIASFVGLGFVLYLLLDRILFFHSHDADDGHTHKGVLGAASLSIHSFLDGIAIGLAFHVSVTVGAVVAVAVLAHDFSDGINTVNFIIRERGSRKRALRWLLVDALTPVLGILASQHLTISEASLGIILALFAGGFIYMGASDLIPESHHNHPQKITTLMTVLGIAVLYAVIRIAGA